MQIISLILLVFLILCAVFAALSRNLFHTVLIFMVFGVVLSVIWLLLQAPDLAITEAAVGVGVSAVLYFLALHRLSIIKGRENDDDVDAP